MINVGQQVSVSTVLESQEFMPQEVPIYHSFLFVCFRTYLEVLQVTPGSALVNHVQDKCPTHCTITMSP